MGMNFRDTGYKPTKTGYQTSEYTVDHSVTEKLAIQLLSCKSEVK